MLGAHIFRIPIRVPVLIVYLILDIIDVLEYHLILLQTGDIIDILSRCISIPTLTNW